MKKIITALALMGLGAVSTTAMAQGSGPSVTGNMKVKVKVPDMLVLYYWDEVGIEFTEQNMPISPGKGAYKEPLSGSDIEVTDTNTAITAATITAQPLSTSIDETTISVNLKNAWAVRSISNGQVSLAIANASDGSDKLVIGNDQLPSSKILVKEPKVKSNTGGQAADKITLQSGWEAKKGDITFDLDLSNMKTPGLYTTESDGSTLKLTLSTT